MDPAYSGASTPENQEGSSPSSSDIGSIYGSLPARELPESLIQFVAQPQSPQTTSEPPKKRRKIDLEHSPPKPDVAHIVVKQSVWEITCASSRLQDFGSQLPMQRANIQPYVHWQSSLKPEYIEVVGDTKETIFYAPLPPRNILPDVHIALSLYRYSRKAGKLAARLWTEFGINLLQRDGMDVIQMTFDVKWNVTTSPYYFPHAPKKDPTLCYILNTYFADPNVKAEKWSPQDFYQSVHTPDKNDDVAASIEVESLKAELYPFQKRAV